VAQKLDLTGQIEAHMLYSSPWTRSSVEIGVPDEHERAAYFSVPRCEKSCPLPLPCSNEQFWAKFNGAGRRKGQPGLAGLLLHL